MPSHRTTFVATSPDGMITREDRGIDWLHEANAGLPDETALAVLPDGIVVRALGGTAAPRSGRGEPAPRR